MSSAIFLVTAITACGTGDGDSDSASSDPRNGITADTEIYLAHQSEEERDCLEETFQGDELGGVLQSWAESALDDSPLVTARLADTEGLWECGYNEFSTLRAIARSIFPSVPQAEAPVDLSGVPWPSIRSAYLAVIARLPETLDGAKREDGSGQEVFYLDDAGDRRFVIEAGDFSDPDYGGKWKVSDGLISRLLSPYFTGSAIGIGDGILWLRFTAPENDAQDARTIHVINWGEPDASLWFQVMAFTTEDADLLAKTFAEAASGG